MNPAAKRSSPKRPSKRSRSKARVGTTTTMTTIVSMAASIITFFKVCLVCPRGFLEPGITSRTEPGPPSTEGRIPPDRKAGLHPPGRVATFQPRSHTSACRFVSRHANATAAKVHIFLNRMLVNVRH